jgi:hypothetical protein
MYPYNYIIPNNSNGMYRNTNDLQGKIYSYDMYHDTNDDRFLLAPLVVGGLAGTALGFGIANNNQLNNKVPCCGWQMMPMYYSQPYPIFNNSNSFYY